MAYEVPIKKVTENTYEKIIKPPVDFVPEMLDGLLKAHPDQPGFKEGIHLKVRANSSITGKVALATEGGSGHLLVLLGYVGKGMLDGCPEGNVFLSSGGDKMLSVAKQINGKKDEVYIYGN